MANRRVTLLILMLLLLYVPSNAVGNEGSPAVEQFGHVFEEVVIADSSDDIREPRDLEFHPGRANELWVANRATDSMTIVENTGLDNQTSQNRKDAYSNHFLEEVSAIAFGAYHPEFDWQWGSAQESANTYCGQGSPNNFMGPTLWPSSMSHYAVEHQNDDLLGSHIDMNHESPFGVGMAHDSANKYWYNDGYYGELVYYDFQLDHDTGYDDHSDAIVRRYSEIQLSHVLGVPGHMVLDKDSDILYISDPGANRVLWVNTGDTSTTSTDIMSSSTRLEPLQEYSRIAGVEWGVLDTGLNRPSGIALVDDKLFVSEYGNGQIVAYELSTNGKSATEAGSIQTTASSIMGLEIGPNGHIYYVDNGQDEVVRIDPYTDEDGDGVVDQDDNCPLIANADQANHDLDALGDVCDQDIDNDSVLNNVDNCPSGDVGWVASVASDYDSDGCRDSSEDYDDDNDNVIDIRDDCPVGERSWSADAFSDYDSDGCRDAGEDTDDDDDNVCDTGSNEAWSCMLSTTGADLCPTSPLSFTSMLSSDADQDGCEDRDEDEDDDNDGYLDKHDDCPNEAGMSDSGRLFGCPDSDGDGYANSIDEFVDESSQWADIDEDGFGDNSDGFEGDACPASYGTSSLDRLGCQDSDADGWSNPSSSWTTLLGADAFPAEASQHLDQDADGYGDNPLGNEADACPEVSGASFQDRFGCLDTDGDGWSDAGDMLPLDATQHLDQDMDGFGDSQTGNQPDACIAEYGLSIEQKFGCPDADGDGWADTVDAFPDDAQSWSDTDLDNYPDQIGTNRSDACPEVMGDSYEDRLGCLDSDGDGWSDAADAFPNDAMRFEASESSSSVVVFAGIGVLLLTLTLGFFVSRKRSSPTHLDQINAFEDAKPVPSVHAPAGPPLPASGLPAGWTMEQWAWYGEDYLKNQ